jgi:hypothetical protein
MSEYRMLKELLGLFVNDVEKGIDPRNAGWTEAPKNNIQKLIEIGLCEIENNKVRVAFHPLPSEVIEKLDEEGKWLADVHQEMVRATQILNEIIQTINNPVFQPAATFLGWKRMLYTSSFPVVIDRILQEGFSADEWVPLARKASGALSLSVVKRWWNENDVLFGLNKLSCIEKGVLVNFNVDKVARILKWDIVTSLLNKNVVITLGLLWFADSKIKDILYAESMVYIQRHVWGVLEQIIGEVSGTIRTEIFDTVKAVENITSEKDKVGRIYPIACWNFIIRLPW